MNYVGDVIEMLCSVHVEQIKINEVFQESESFRARERERESHIGTTEKIDDRTERNHSGMKMKRVGV